MIPRTCHDVLKLLQVETLPTEDSMFQARTLELVQVYCVLFGEGFILGNRERILKELTQIAVLSQAA